MKKTIYILLFATTFLNAQDTIVGYGENSGLRFEKQSLHALGYNNLGHTTLKENEDGGTRFYIMPKGTTDNDNLLRSGIKLFATDYENDGQNYFDYGNWVTKSEIIFNSKRNGTFAKNLPFVWKFQDNYELMKLQSKSNGALYLNTPLSNQKDWTVFVPFQMGRTTTLLGRDNAAASEYINNAYFNNKWWYIEDGEAHRFSLSTDGSFSFWTAIDGLKDERLFWRRKFRIKNDGTLNIEDPKYFDSDVLAGQGGLVKGDIYSDSNGFLRIKM